VVAPIDNPSSVATLQARINEMESAHAIAMHANAQAWENGLAALTIKGAGEESVAENDTVPKQLHDVSVVAPAEQTNMTWLPMDISTPVRGAEIIRAAREEANPTSGSDEIELDATFQDGARALNKTEAPKKKASKWFNLPQSNMSLRKK
jgi:hypothetical protein